MLPTTKSEILHATVVSVHSEYIMVNRERNDKEEDMYTADFSLLSSIPDVAANDKVRITYSGISTLSYPGNLCGVTEIIKEDEKVYERDDYR